MMPPVEVTMPPVTRLPAVAVPVVERRDGVSLGCMVLEDDMGAHRTSDSEGA